MTFWVPYHTMHKILAPRLGGARSRLGDAFPIGLPRAGMCEIQDQEAKVVLKTQLSIRSKEGVNPVHS